MSGDVVALARSLVALGSEARQVRKARGLTLKDVAARSGISLSHLSAIERGASSPSMATLQALAGALGVTPDWFFARRPGAGPLEQAFVVRAANRRDLHTLYAADPAALGYSDQLLSASIGGAFYLGVSVFEPFSKELDDGLRRSDGELHGLVLEGELELRLGDETITLRAGDSFSFHGGLPHRARNRTDKPCRIVWGASPVVIPTAAGDDPAPRAADAS